MRFVVASFGGALLAFQPTDAVLVLVGVIITTLFNLWGKHRDELNARRLTAGSVDTADADVVFNAMTTHLTRLEASLAEVSKEATAWRAEAEANRLKAIEQSARADSLGRHVVELEDEVASLREQIRTEARRRAARRPTGH